MVPWRLPIASTLLLANLLYGQELGHHAHAGHGAHEACEDEHGHDDHGGEHAHGTHGTGGHGGHGHEAHGMEVRLWWKDAYVAAGLMSFLSFAGAALMIPLRMPRIGAVVEYCSLAFAASVLVADALIHLLPHALEGADHETMTAVGIAATAGCLLILTIPGFVELWPWHHRGHEHRHEVHAYGIANLVTEMMHNFVDGIGLGIAYRTSASAGFSTALAVAVHELPQEIGDFMVLRAAGFPVGRLLSWNFIASLTCLGGVALVHVVGQIDLAATVQRYATAFTAGSFLSLALNMIFPQVSESISKNHRGIAAGLAHSFCVVIAMVAVYMLVRIGDLEVGHEGHGHAGHGDGGHGGHGGHGHEL